MKSTWQQFLEDEGAELRDGLAISFGETPADYASLTNTISDLSDFGLLCAQGSDTRKFLQGQSTCDFQTSDLEASPPGAICNPKGRMITSFQSHGTSEDKILLSMDRALVTSTLAVLQKYAAFFKTELSDESNTYNQFGLSGPGLADILVGFFPSIPQVNHSVVNADGATLTSLSAELFIIVTKADAAPQLWQALSSDIQAVGLSWWQLKLIAAGLAFISPSLSEQLVPQMLNLQATGAISFTKGCYTGQEVVARMQYLGKLKRRTYHLTLATTHVPNSGDEITTTDAKVVGTVVLAAPADKNSVAVLAVLRESALEQSELVLSGESMAVTLDTLPYVIAEQ